MNNTKKLILLVGIASLVTLSGVVYWHQIENQQSVSDAESILWGVYCHPPKRLLKSK